MQVEVVKLLPGDGSPHFNANGLWGWLAFHGNFDCTFLGTLVLQTLSLR